jgi:hypothetical protein
MQEQLSCNICQGIGMYTKCIWVGHMIKIFIISILLLFWQGIVGGPADIMTVLISRHTFLWKLRITVATVALIFPASSDKMVANGDRYTAPLITHKQKNCLK